MGTLGQPGPLMAAAVTAPGRLWASSLCLEDVRGLGSMSLLVSALPAEPRTRLTDDAPAPHEVVPSQEFCDCAVGLAGVTKFAPLSEFRR